MADESPPALAAPDVYLHQQFDNAKALRTGIQRTFLNAFRWCKSAGGGGCQKFFTCTGRKLIGGKEMGCRARVRAYRSRKSMIWRITVADLSHDNCTGEQKGSSVAALAGEISTLVGGNPGISGTAIRRTVRAQTGVDVHTRSALRGKANALGTTAKGNAEGFTVLSSFLVRLQSGSRGAVTSVKWDNDGAFLRCFVMPGGSANVAANSLQQCFSLDGAHLKGAWSGFILTITTTDANNKINLCAFAVVPSECASSYRYLLKHAMRNTLMKAFINNAATTCFTDGEKGADSAMEKLAPLTEIRHCLQHIIRSIGTVGDVGARNIYSAARHPTKAGFDRHMDILSAIAPDAHEKLDDIPHETWAHYASRKNVCCDQVTSNPAESSNSMLGPLRELPVFSLVHGGVLLIAKRLYEAGELKKDDAHQKFTPHAMTSYTKEFQWSRGLEASPLGGHTFYIQESKKGCSSGQTATVRWSKSGKTPTMKCTCEGPQKMLLPCRHVLAAATAPKKTAQTLSLIGKGFLIDRYRKLASDERYKLVLPVWDALEKDLTKKPPPTTGATSKDGQPPAKKKRKKRIPSVGERNTSKRPKTKPSTA